MHGWSKMIALTFVWKIRYSQLVAILIILFGRYIVGSNHSMDKRHSWLSFLNLVKALCKWVKENIQGRIVKPRVYLLTLILLRRGTLMILSPAASCKLTRAHSMDRHRELREMAIRPRKLFTPFCRRKERTRRYSCGGKVRTWLIINTLLIKVEPL